MRVESQSVSMTPVDPSIVTLGNNRQEGIIIDNVEQLQFPVESQLLVDDLVSSIPYSQYSEHLLDSQLTWATDNPTQEVRDQNIPLYHLNALHDQDMSLHQNFPHPVSFIDSSLSLIQPSKITQPRRRTYGRLHFITKPDKQGVSPPWTPHEFSQRRRILTFQALPLNDTIYVSCSPLAGPYHPTMLTLSCIHWPLNPPNEKKGEYSGKLVFTSVDIIALVEKLVKIRFNIQEKNRIRRNIEAYKPVTVKKDGATLKFFNQIMRYENPRPRSIEKDIKVFLWEDVTKALKKIMHQYCIDGEVPLGKNGEEVTKPRNEMPLRLDGILGDGANWNQARFDGQFM